MDTIVRHWHILRLIPLKGKTEAGVIHKKLQDISPDFAVTKRTIERDLHKLKDAFFPIECDGNKPQGWSWRKDFEGLDIPGMDLTEALTYRMAEEYFDRLLPKSYLSALKPKFQQARKQLKKPEEKIIGEWPEKVALVPRNQPLLPPPVDNDVMDTVYDCLFREKRFEVTYKAPHGSKRMEISPLGLIISEPIVYLAGTCWGYEDVRLFALHRMSEATPLEKAINKPEDFVLKKYIEGGALGFAHTLEKKINLEAYFTRGAAAHLRESPLSEDQTISEVDEDWVRIKARVNDTEQLRWWLLGFGAQVEVIGPQSLLEEMRETALEMAELYSQEQEDDRSSEESLES